MKLKIKTCFGTTTPVVRTFEEASKATRVRIDHEGIGQREFGSAEIEHEGARYHVSYNGKIWKGSQKEQSRELVFSPYEGVTL